jgi:hypothetical protein
MVASEATSLACRSLKLDRIIRAEKLTRMDNKPNLSGEVKLSGLDLKESPLWARRSFFLDIPPKKQNAPLSLRP